MAPRVNTIKRGDTRFYVEPTTGEKVPGVTSIISMLPKDFLKYWSAKLSSELAVELTAAGMLSGLVDRDPEGAVDYLKGAHTRFVRKAAEDGSAAHALFEARIRGDEIGRIKPEMEPFLRHFDEFLDKVQPDYTFVEETVWSDTYNYAGTFDAFVTIDGQKIWMDNKTTRSGVHEEAGIQMAAYRFADFILRADGSKVPQPKADGAAVLHIRPEGWNLVPVRADEDLFEIFLHLKEVLNWERNVKKTVIGRATYFGPGEKATAGRKRPTPVRKGAVK